jgi:tetratricopeptide (TPR) repeat protein
MESGAKDRPVSRAGASMRFPLVRFGALAIALAGLAAAAAWSVRVGWADYWARQFTVAATEKALALTPGQASYYVQLAVLRSDDDPKRAFEALQRAVALDPFDSRSWIELGLRVEADGHNAAAEQYFLRAAEVDKEYLPKWTLANYYFRRDEESKFWFWAKAAAQMLYGDPLPLFRLSGKVVEDGNLLDRLEIRRPDIQAAYLSYLLSQNRLDLIGPATQRLLDSGRESDIPLLLTACDRLIDARLVDEALAIWNRLAEARKIPYAPLAPGAEKILANDSFLPTPALQGFAWRLPTVEGIGASREENPSGLRLTFSGGQPENCEPLFRVLPVRENTAYEFNAVYRTAGIQPNTGLAWRITDMDGGDIMGAPESLASEDGARAKIHFVAPSGCRLVRIALVYRRALGTTRIEGSIVLREAGLQRASQFPE